MNPKWQEKESFPLPETPRNRTAFPSTLPSQLADVAEKKRKRDRKKEKDEGAYHNREAVKCARDTRFHGRQNFLSVVGFSPLFLLCAKYDGFAYSVRTYNGRAITEQNTSPD